MPAKTLVIHFVNFLFCALLLWLNQTYEILLCNSPSSCVERCSSSCKLMCNWTIQTANKQHGFRGCRAYHLCTKHQGINNKVPSIGLKDECKVDNSGTLSDNKLESANNLEISQCPVDRCPFTFSYIVRVSKLKHTMPHQIWI